MPSGVYTRTAQMKINIGLAAKGRNPWNKGRRGIYSKETIEKMKKNNVYKGKKNPQLTEANKKRIYDAELRKRMSLRQMGKNGSNWKGGITPINTIIRHSIEMKLWREAIYSRDNWTCVKCKQRGGVLVSHHIMSFSIYKEFRTSIENGVTLCKWCHKQFHSKYGTRNNTRQQFEEWINVS